MPRYGGEKLWLDIKDDLVKHEIKMGRDQLMTFLREHHLLVKKTKKHHITTGWHSTNSKHFYYKSPNLIKDLVPTYAEQVFVNDIIENDKTIKIIFLIVLSFSINQLIGQDNETKRDTNKNLLKCLLILMI